MVFYFKLQDKQLCNGKYLNKNLIDKLHFCYNSLKGIKVLVGKRPQMLATIASNQSSP